MEIKDGLNDCGKRYMGLLEEDEKLVRRSAGEFVPDEPHS